MEENKKIKIENMNSIKVRVDGWVTMEDALLNCPIGSKVILENGRMFTKFAYNFFEDRSYKDIRVSACYLLDEKVEEIQIPEYTRVVKSKGEILDKEEKEYLNAVIAPFRSKVVSIEKDFGIDYEYIKMVIIEENSRTYYKYTMEFPRFKAGTMYKGMEWSKEYTLKELGLEGE